jgi:hypothetical protein
MFNEDQSLPETRLNEVKSLVIEAQKLHNAIQSFIKTVKGRRGNVMKHDLALDSCTGYARGKLFPLSCICYYNPVTRHLRIDSP